MVDYDRVPNQNHRFEVEQYIEYGRPMGDFMTAVFNNDLKGAAMYADDANRPLLFQWGVFLFDQAPLGCYGPNDAVAKWIAKGGLQGQVR